MHDIQHLRVFCFLLSSFTESGRGWERGTGESKHKEETPATFSQVEIIPLELFLTLFFYLFFSFVRCKNNKKKIFQKNRNHNIYTTSIWQLPLCISKNVVFSLHVQITLILEGFFKLILLYRKFLEDKSRLQEGDWVI